MTEGSAKYTVDIRTNADAAKAKAIQQAIAEIGNAAKRTSQDLESMNRALNAAGGRSSGLASSPNNALLSALGIQSPSASPSASRRVSLGRDPSAVDSQRALGAFGQASMLARAQHEKLTKSVEDSPASYARFRGALIGVTSLLYALKRGFTEVTEAAVTKERADLRLDAALANRGQLTQAYRSQLMGLAKAQEQLTGKSSNDWTEAITNLTEHGANPQNINTMVQAVENLEGMMNGYIVQASKVMGKALEGNLEQLREYGILVNTNATLSQQFEQALSGLAARGAGTLRHEMTGLGGVIDDWSIQMRTAKESTGKFFEPFIRWTLNDSPVAMVGQGLGRLSASVYGSATAMSTAKNKTDQWSGSAMTATEAAKKLSLQLERIEQASRRADKALGDLKTRNDAIVSSSKSIIEAQKDYQLKVIDEAEKRGLPKNVATIARYRIEQSVKGREFQLEQEADLKNEQAAQVRLNQLAFRRRDAQKDFDSAQSKYNEKNTPANSQALEAAKAILKERTQEEQNTVPGLVESIGQSRLGRLTRSRVAGFEAGSANLGLRSDLGGLKEFSNSRQLAAEIATASRMAGATNKDLWEALQQNLAMTGITVGQVNTIFNQLREIQAKQKNIPNQF